MCEIEGRTLNRDKEDEWTWNDGETQNYMVKSAYKKLNSRIRDKKNIFIRYLLENKSFTNIPTLLLKRE